jgi:hypothetical protein
MVVAQRRSKRYGSIALSISHSLHRRAAQHRQRPWCNITVGRRIIDIHIGIPSHAALPACLACLVSTARRRPISLCPNSLCFLFLLSRGRAARIIPAWPYGTAAVVCLVYHSLLFLRRRPKLLSSPINQLTRAKQKTPSTQATQPTRPAAPETLLPSLVLVLCSQLACPPVLLRAIAKLNRRELARRLSMLDPSSKVPAGWAGRLLFLRALDLALVWRVRLREPFVSFRLIYSISYSIYHSGDSLSLALVVECLLRTVPNPLSSRQSMTGPRR